NAFLQLGHGGRVVRIGGDHQRGDDLAPLGVRQADHRTRAHVRVRAQCLFDGRGGDLHPAAVDHVVGAAEDLQHTIGDPAQVLGAKPAVVQLPRRRVAVARGQHVAGQLDPAGGPDAYVDTVQWPAVVDTTAAGLRHSVGADGVYPGVAGVRA